MEHYYTLPERIRNISGKCILLTIALLFGATLAGQEVTTDKLDYQPGETAYASGTGWYPNENISLVVHEEPTIHEDRVTRTSTDVNGVFTNVAIYSFDSSDYGASFTLTATGETSGFVATATFTDGQSLIWAWRNEPGPTLNTWDAGTTIQGSNSVYAEGEVIPFRWTITPGNPAPQLQEGVSYTIELDWAYAGGTTSPEKLFFDYLTSYDATESTSPPFGPGSDLGGGFQGTYINTVPIPNDIGDGAPNPATVPHPAGNFTLYNINPATVTISSYIAENVNSNQEDRKLQITFTPSNNDGILDEFLNVGIAWGGHLATQIAYGANNGAADFPGASPQMVVDLDPTSSGDVSNLNINPNAIVAQGQITIIKDADPDDAQDFEFTITGPDGANITSPFTLDDDADGTLSNQQTFVGLLEGEYVITESSVNGWTLASITPVENGAEDTTPGDISSSDINTRTATITVANGEEWVVTFLNEEVQCVNPDVTADDATICEGGSVDLSTLNVVADGGTLSYYGSLSDAQGGLVADQINTTVSPGIGTTSYFVRSEVTVNGVTCYGTHEIVVTVNPVPPCNITSESQPDGSVKLTASGGVSYLWSNNETGASITVNESGSYSVTVTGDNGCSSTCSTDVIQDCETAWAFDDGLSTCFEEIDNIERKPQWGFTNLLPESGEYQFTLVEGGPGICNSKGSTGYIVGDATLVYNGSTVELTITTTNNHQLSELHVWVDCDKPLPYQAKGKKNGEYVTAPGQFNNSPPIPGGQTTKYTFDAPCSGGPVWVAIHAVTCELLGEDDDPTKVPFLYTASGTALDLDYDQPLSTKTDVSLSTLKASPVPFGNNLSLELDIQYDSEVVIEVFDMSGRLILSQKTSAKKGANELPIYDAYRIADKVSIVKVTTERETLLEKVISLNRK